MIFILCIFYVKRLEDWSLDLDRHKRQTMFEFSFKVNSTLSINQLFDLSSIDLYILSIQSDSIIRSSYFPV